MNTTRDNLRDFVLYMHPATPVDRAHQLAARCGMVLVYEGGKWRLEMPPLRDAPIVRRVKREWARWWE